MTQALTKPATDVLIRIDPEDAAGFFAQFRPVGAAVPRARIDHDAGVFLVPNEDGEDDELETLTDIIAIDVRSGRIMWEPESQPGDGALYCRSSDAVQPDDGMPEEGPCARCTNSKWGPRIGGKSTPPECAETVTVICYRLDGGPAFLFTGQKTALAPIKTFFDANFRRAGRPPFSRFFSVGLDEKAFGSGRNARKYYVPTLELGDVVPADIQQTVYELWKQAKAGLLNFASDTAPTADDDDNNKEDASPAPRQTGGTGRPVGRPRKEVSDPPPPARPVGRPRKETPPVRTVEVVTTEDADDLDDEEAGLPPPPSPESRRARRASIYRD